MAGNANSGHGIPFRLTDAELKRKIEQFREEYGDGSKGMVTWPRFCAFLGYSIEEVRECYVKGREGKNAYNVRSELLKRFRTECKALTYETSEGKLTLGRDEANTDYLTPPGEEDKPPDIRIMFGGGDERWIEAVK
jgi:hypothetical protein